MDIKTILDEIDANVGIRRSHVCLDNEDTAFKYFVGIANHLLMPEGKKYDAEPLREAITTMIRWTYMIPESDLSFTKGIVLRGHTGCGKTFLMRTFAYFLKLDEQQYHSNGHCLDLRLKIVNARRISGEYQDANAGGIGVILKYSAAPFLCIDDIGAEATYSNSFGNQLNVIDEIIDRRLESALLTFGTTNLGTFVKDKNTGAGYDSRTVSRIGALFNIVPINNEKDYRLARALQHKGCESHT
ncbi:MAG: hypothetical protein LKK08_06165 [Bacteroidales bacterium]|jgi:predicted ATPase|nr:hypothetical protein [Bacteroidales bacterium]